MRIFPAIDLRNGQCVRLKQGDYNDETVYGDPIEMAEQWERDGASYLHLVDLDAAKGDPSENGQVIEQIVSHVNIPVQVGGGVRDLERIQTLLDKGVTRVILGTAAVKDPAFAKEAAAQFGGDRVVVSIDARDGYVATDGWIETSELEAVDFAVQMQSYGIKTIVYTDIAKDGMLQGPNIDALYEMNEATSLNVIASGGVTSLKDIRALNDVKLYGAIVGKALYENKVNLAAIMKEPSTC
ncbi:1-(5-phosphoribosyl)-5-[(5-phosphoribosylamino)methylideneamino]imidazole-4-carboxamide isomerase [Alkalibacillus almallahensis]|uniref:1-(5-phosphoribosyl)-5-[(5- phosphoribosylamino)methylideneamino]imidazole-4- carboxamide isomerase n=1 Tax=Alkalibacillus almallahensis TaxID=1379154 RepID=UPI001423A19A|nr:1-(5-phosphoribosyl)-5-[(5-phosphoribosylamino)methylideneamino]imidazole-4-carboxamide isomerase [Alkalibacillus almallahensis]NIK11971.1 phosphoribosylformimino-5-aminoimidazole carboxamide ribotide isomerase [Alkalibacillus almallahensis]